MALTFTLGSPCAGGNHWDVIIRLDGRSITMPITYREIREPMDQAEIDEFLRLYVRVLISREPTGTSMANTRAKLAGMSLRVSL